MKLVDAIRSHLSNPDPPGDQASPPDASEAPMPGYDRLDEREVGARLDRLSQVELAALEAYERSHGDRAYVLDKLRYMRTSEPLPSYDTLSPEQIAGVLADADAETVKAVRDYERKFRHRPQVMDETARVLPTAKASAGEDRAREAREARVRQGFASRAKSVRDRSAQGARPPSPS